MPKDSGIDWETAKALYHQGLNFPRIAERLGCNTNTVRSRAHREQWVKTNSKSLEILHQEPNLDQLTANWRYRIQKICERYVSGVEHKDPLKLGPRDFKMMNESLRIIDDLQRRNLKMDQQDEDQRGQDNYPVRIVISASQARKDYGNNPPPPNIIVIADSEWPAFQAESKRMLDRVVWEEPTDPDERRAWGLPELPPPPQLPPPAEGEPPQLPPTA